MKIDFSRNPNQPLYIQLYQEIIHRIKVGELKTGDKLPSIRKMMKDSNLSKTTVESAYNQLLFEGYIESKEKKGFYIQQLDVSTFTTSRVDKDISIEEEVMLPVVDESTFDFGLWRRMQGYVLRDYASELLSYGSHQGELILREEIVRFVREHRGVNATADQVVVGAGVQYLFGIIVSLMSGDNKTIGVENPGFRKANYIFKDYGYDLALIDVKKDGLNIDQLYDANCNLVYVSPSHQYPTGQVMDVGKRYDLLQWAKRCNSYIIEDDYDSVLRYNSYPIPALQGLDQDDRVIYLGSFSKLVLPSIRVSYMIIPKHLVKHFEQIRGRYTQTSSKFEQLTLAVFMREGFFERHLRKLIKIYRKKHQVIMNFLMEELPQGVEIVGHESGTHILLKVYDETYHYKLLELKHEVDYPLEVVHETDTRSYFLLTYSGIPTEWVLVKMKQLIEKIR